MFKTSSRFINWLATIDSAASSARGANGAVQSPRYTLYTLQGTNAEVPRDCGYGGRISGDSYTLGAGPGFDEPGLHRGSVCRGR